MKLVSVIVPVYNVERYLSECLISLRKQTYSNFEVILVDDGSTDNSGAICEEFTKLDQRFSVIHTSNQGLGPARNVGLSQCNGDFICFVDSDDLCVEEYLEKLVDAIEKSDSDIVFCNYIDLYPNKTVKHHAHSPCELSPRDFFISCLTIKPLSRIKTTPGSYMWNKLFRKEVIGDTKFVFTKGAEDEIFIADLIQKVTKVSYISDYLYLYRHRPTSLSANPVFFHKFLDSRKIVYEKLCKNNLYSDLVAVAFIDKAIKYMSIVCKYQGNDEYFKYASDNLHFAAKLLGRHNCASQLTRVEKCKLMVGSLPYPLNVFLYRLSYKIGALRKYLS